MSVDSVLAAAAVTVGCEVDADALERHWRISEVPLLVRAAAGLYVNTDEFRNTDVVFAPIFGPDADEDAVATRPAFLAEGDQVRAWCRDTLDQIKPRLVELGVFKELP